MTPALEAVHLHEHGVEGLLTLVVSAADAGEAGAADGIDFVDEEDAGRVLLGLGEHIAHAAGANAHEHLHEVRTADAEEGHLRLAGDGLGQQGLARAGRPHEEDAFGDAAAEGLEALGIAQEFDDFLHLFLGLVYAGDIFEAHLGLVFAEEASAGFAEGEGTVATAHAAHGADEEEVEEQEKEQERQERDQDGTEPIGAVLLRHLDAHLSQVLLKVSSIQEVELEGFGLFLAGPVAFQVSGAIAFTHQENAREGLVLGDGLSLPIDDAPIIDALPEVALGKRLGFAAAQSTKSGGATIVAAAEDTEKGNNKDRQEHPDDEGALPFRPLSAGFVRRGGAFGAFAGAAGGVFVGGGFVGVFGRGGLLRVRIGHLSSSGFRAHVPGTR